MTRLAHTHRELEEFLDAFAAEACPHRNVVMTMGALHDGHAELFRAARDRCGALIVTIFVNPLQFGPNEDFDRYPRTLDADLKVAEAAGVDVVFAPDVAEVYPGGEPMVRIAPGAMGDLLEGEFRPGFFGGVLTVVTKLLNLTRPEHAFFGEKDAQQLACVRRLVLDLNMPVEIVSVPTVRDADGLAKSSRNRFLSEDERITALNLSRALFAGRAAAADGADAVRDAANTILDLAHEVEPPIALDYLALVDPSDFAEVPADYSGEAILALAARVGTTRLIDNVRLFIRRTPSTEGIAD